MLGHKYLLIHKGPFHKSEKHATRTLLLTRVYSGGGGGNGEYSAGVRLLSEGFLFFGLLWFMSLTALCSAFMYHEIVIRNKNAIKNFPNADSSSFERRKRPRTPTGHINCGGCTQVSILPDMEQRVPHFPQYIAHYPHNHAL